MDHQLKAKIAVVEHRKSNNWDIDNNRSFYEELTVDDIYVVWFTYTLGNWKCLLSSEAWTDTSYYEVTYNAAKKEMYLDWYKKIDNVCIVDDPIDELREKLGGNAR